MLNVGLTSCVTGVERKVGVHPLDAAEQNYDLTLVADQGALPADHHVAHGESPVYVVDLGNIRGGVAWLLPPRAGHHFHFDRPSNVVDWRRKVALSSTVKSGHQTISTTLWGNDALHTHGIQT